MASVMTANEKNIAPQLTLYMRQGCHLCEDMEQQLHELLDEGSFELCCVDIDDNEVLKTAFNVRVPVLILNNVELCEHFLDLEAVTTALSSYNSQLAVNAQASI